MEDIIDRNFLIEDGALKKYLGNEKDVFIPEAVKEIYGNAFTTCTEVRKIFVSKNVSKITEFAFLCDNLTEIKVDDNNRTYCDIDGVLFTKDKMMLVIYPIGRVGQYTIPDGTLIVSSCAFARCFNLTDVSIPQTVINIGIQAFEQCKKLKYVAIPSNVSHIGAHAFTGCENLMEISVDKNNKTFYDIDGVLFNKTEATLIKCPPTIIGEYTVPDNVTTIQWHAFENCKSLTTLYMSADVKKIGHLAFLRCDCLADIYFGGTKDDWRTIIEPSFDDYGKYTVHCSDGLIKRDCNG